MRHEIGYGKKIPHQHVNKPRRHVKLNMYFVSDRYKVWAEAHCAACGIYYQTKKLPYGATMRKMAFRLVTTLTAGI